MLFLNTLQVNAADWGTTAFSDSFTLYASADSCWYSYSTTATNLVYPNAYQINGGLHVEIPISLQVATSSIDSEIFSTGYLRMAIGNFTYSFSNFTASNVCLKTDEGDLLIAFPRTNFWSNQVNSEYTKRLSPDGAYLIFNCYLSADLVFSDGRTASNTYQINQGTFSYSCIFGYGATSSSSASMPVVDSGANQSLNSISQSSQAIETSVTSDTGGGLLATIKNFFGSFFSNIINSFISLFVPSSDFFSDWFDDVNTLLSDKLGMLYAPFDLLISTLQAVYSADSTESGIPFPGIEWDGTYLVEPFTFYFSSLGQQFNDLREAVYFGTDVIFLFAFLYLLQKKIALVITGSEVNG